MAYMVRRLETVLRAWEDLWFLINVVNKIHSHEGKKPFCPKKGAVVNYEKFRRFILNLGGRKEGVNVIPFIEPECDFLKEGFLPSFAPSVTDWCIGSRRVFHLTEDIQILLDATSIDKICWRDVHFPFRAFAISLEEPIIDKEGDQFDFILLSSGISGIQNDGTVGRRIEFRFFTKKCDLYIPLTQPNKQNMLNRIRKGQWQHLKDITTRFLKRIDTIMGSYFCMNADCEEELITTTAERIFNLGKGERKEDFRGTLDKDTLSLWDSMIRITVGMCLYLKTLPPGDSHVSKWEKPTTTGLPDPKAITNESEVCTVSSCYKLTTEEREILGINKNGKKKPHYELRCHFREGHWRRPPGLGHDPMAEKTIWVRPTIVRRDRLQNGQLPGGTKKIIIA